MMDSQGVCRLLFSTIRRTDAELFIAKFTRSKLKLLFLSPWKQVSTSQNHLFCLSPTWRFHSTLHPQSSVSYIEAQIHPYIHLNLLVICSEGSSVQVLLAIMTDCSREFCLCQNKKNAFRWKGIGVNVQEQTQKLQKPHRCWPREKPQWTIEQCCVDHEGYFKTNKSFKGTNWVESIH